MKYDFVVLGALGMQGKIVCRDLLEKGYSVLFVDKEKPLSRNLLNCYKRSSYFILADITNVDKIQRIIQRSCANVVINCAEDDINLRSLKICIQANVHSIDLGSTIPMTKKQLNLDRILKEKNLIHITGCGSVPGIGNVMLRHASEKLDKINTVEVGFAWDSNIKEFVVPFSIESVAYEFTHPATILENGKFIKKSPMSTIEERNHKFIGKQKCFLAEHSEPYTFYHYFGSKGLKNVRFYAGFPEHSFKTIKMLIDLGLNKSKKIEFRKTKVKPVDFLTAILRRLDSPQGYKESECLWLRIFGEKDGKEKLIEMECIAPTLDGWEDAGCNIDTGIPASIIAQMIKRGVIKERGSFSPESIVPTDLFFEELAKKQIIIYENNKIINNPVVTVRQSNKHRLKTLNRK
ncbi:MAG: saccharopine dehydrogenase C-terminal domain-containing protein [Candidatus Nitrosotenuis sp.]